MSSSFLHQGAAAPAGATGRASKGGQAPALTAPQTVAVTAALSRWAGEPGGLLPALHDIQAALRFVPPAAVGAIAAAFNLSRAEVHGVVTYYHHFRSEPPGRHVVQVCRAEACQAMGAGVLLDHVQRRLGCAAHATSDDGRYTVEPAYCLGLCAASPAVRVDEQLHGRLTPQRFDRVIDALEGQ